MTLASGPIAPAWAILPLALLSLVVVGIHVTKVLRSDMPASRRRIRVANGLIMMFTIPLFAFALSLADPASQQKLFAMSWMLTFALITIIFGIACFDIVNNIRIYYIERSRIRGEIARPKLSSEQPPRLGPPSS